MAAERFWYDAENHRYYVGKREVPGLTTLLSQAGCFSAEAYYTEEGRLRGRVVHAACLAYDLGAFDPLQIDPKYLGYVHAYASIAQELRPRWKYLEQAQVNRRYFVACRIDRLGHLAAPAFAEIKTGEPEDWHGIQTAGQDVVWHGDRHGYVRRLVFYLRADGSKNVREHTKRSDYDKFFEAWQQTRSTNAAAF